MAWNPIQVHFPRAYEGLAETAMSALDANQRHALERKRMAQQQQQFDAAQAAQAESDFQRAYGEIVKAYHAGELTEEEATSRLRMFGAQFDQPARAKQNLPADATNPNFIVQKNMAAQVAAQPPTTDLVARNAAITARSPDAQPQSPTQPPMMPTPGITGEVPAEPDFVAGLPAPNRVVAAAQVERAKEAQLAGRLKFRRNGQDFSITGRDEYVAGRKAERDAAIADQLAKFDAAAGATDDEAFKRNAPSLRALIAAGEDINAKDVLGMMGKQDAIAAQDRRLDTRNEFREHLERDILEPGRNKRADDKNRTSITVANIMAAANKWRESIGLARLDLAEAAQVEREAKNYFTATKYAKQIEQGMALGQTLRGIAGGDDPARVLQTRDAQVSLARFFRNGVPSEGEMAFLYKHIGGLADKGQQLMAELKTGALSPLQRKNLENAANAAKAEHDHFAQETKAGFKKRFAGHAKADVVNSIGHGYFHALGADDPNESFAEPAAPAQAPANPVQRANAGAKAKAKGDATLVKGGEDAKAVAWARKALNSANPEEKAMAEEILRANGAK